MATAVTSPDTWESMWAPYDESTYSAVLAEIATEDIILDIGAGDGLLALRMAHKARFVYALERQACLINALPLQQRPSNLQIIVADARLRPLPTDITVAVLLMRHCTWLHLAWSKLTAVGCRTLITNARWGVGIETIDLTAPRKTFGKADMGWYACNCGQIGFIPGPATKLTMDIMDTTQEIIDCPDCRAGS